MAKKNKGKAVQMLSSENYIRKKARTLPILECWINKDWEESGVANIIITRSHTNGNITACYYYVDLYCLGIKDSYHQFNIPQFELQERLDYLN
jgi:hypothetical protein